jgi:hypothetical protein
MHKEKEEKGEREKKREMRRRGEKEIIKKVRICRKER